MKPLSRLLFPLFSALSLAQIPPELTRGFQNDTIGLVVSLSDNEITPGEALRLADTKSTPSFALGDSSGINAAARYVIVCIDPDAPSRANPTRAQVLHYLNTDFAPSGEGVGLSSTNEEGSEPMPWAPPGPPEGTGPHRYVFLLYRQRPRSGFQVKGVPEQDNRTGFNVSAWRIENGLEPAVAGSYFVAEFGDKGAGSGNGTTGGGSNSTTGGGSGSGNGGGSGSGSGSGNSTGGSGSGSASGGSGSSGPSSTAGAVPTDSSTSAATKPESVIWTTCLLLSASVWVGMMVL